ncbi:protease inhibitor I9 family protein [Lysinibacillus xylanilyticus]|uniref:protease inhibitor I9 family protein n=1 Tax=Lysinibacillus xylanilyticus TaxID=582475 RepID=UPI002B24A97F|nr:protease inhibitor I9 family protein [Lysinibacillus xylanilyticus]MEB2302626.1 protease inhibitor I9 family protein [Lysinibacillus xylanilyticus]
MIGKKISLVVATTLVFCGAVSGLNLTKPALAADSNVQDVNILPYKISEELTRKIEGASPSDVFSVIVSFNKTLNNEDYAKLEKEIGEFSRRYTYDTVISGFAGDLTKEQILLLNKTSFVTLIDLDQIVTNYDDIIVESTFSKDKNGWIGGFSDYPYKDKVRYKLRFSLKSLPKEINIKRKGLYLSGYNGSDDLFMFVKKKLDTNDRLKQNTKYSVTFDFDIATNARDEVGVGGSPGKSVFVKIGATNTEPIPVMDKTGFYLMNIDKGNQGKEGKDAFIIGDLQKTTIDSEKYELKYFNNKQRPFIVETDKNGELWLFIGTDSAFEGVTSIYYPRIKVTLKEVKE